MKANEHKKEQPPRDATGKWSREVGKMTERLGYPRGFLWHWFEQLAACVEYETRIDRANAERFGFRLLKGMFDKAGMEMQ